MKNNWTISVMPYGKRYEIGNMDTWEGDDLVIHCEDFGHYSQTLIFKALEYGDERKSYVRYHLKGNHVQKIDKIYPDVEKVMDYYDSYIEQEQMKKLKEREEKQYRYTYATSKLFGKRYTVYAKNEEEAKSTVIALSGNNNVFLTSIEELQP